MEWNTRIFNRCLRYIGFLSEVCPQSCFNLGSLKLYVLNTAAYRLCLHLYCFNILVKSSAALEILWIVVHVHALAKSTHPSILDTSIKKSCLFSTLEHLSIWMLTEVNAIFHRNDLICLTFKQHIRYTAYLWMIWQSLQSNGYDFVYDWAYRTVIHANVTY